MAKKPERRGNDGADATLTTLEIERVLANFIAQQGGVRTPFVYTIKWLWVVGTGPTAHVDVSRAPAHVKPTPSRFVGRKKGL